MKKKKKEKEGRRGREKTRWTEEVHIIISPDGTKLGVTPSVDGRGRWGGVEGDVTRD